MFYHFDIIAATKLQNLYKAFLSFQNYSDSFKNFTADLKKKNQKYFRHFFSDDHNKVDRQQHSIKIWCFFVNDLTNFRVVCKLDSTIVGDVLQF